MNVFVPTVPCLRLCRVQPKLSQGEDETRQAAASYKDDVDVASGCLSVGREIQRREGGWGVMKRGERGGRDKRDSCPRPMSC